MSRKDYIALAAALKAARPNHPVVAPGATDLVLAEVRGWRHAVEATARTLQADNPRFDRGRFLRAAGMEG